MTDMKRARFTEEQIIGFLKAGQAHGIHPHDRNEKALIAMMKPKLNITLRNFCA
jgi:hypothetical protein